MKKILTLIWTISLLGCSSGADVNQALNAEVAIKKQEISQEQKIFQLENDSLEVAYKSWEQNIQKKFPVQDPIIQEHKKSIKAYQKIFQEHKTRLSTFKDSLDTFTKTLEKHSFGQVNDEKLDEAYKVIEQHFNTLRKQHSRLVEDYQTFKDAQDALVKTYVVKE